MNHVEVNAASPVSAGLAAAMGQLPAVRAVNSGGDAGLGLDCPTKLAHIMIVDDEEFNILTVKHHLRSAGYQHFTTTTDPGSALTTMWDLRPDLVLLDVMMPQINGLDILQLMRSDPQLMRTPVIIVTASEEASVKLQALELGANDFLAKPVDSSELILRIRNTLQMKEHQDRLSNYSAELEREVQKRTAELEASQREVVYCLARAGESRDSVTGFHVTRVSKYAGITADQLGFDSEEVERLELASQLHDVGKIGISDLILLKPGKLNDQEYVRMKRHCEFGVKIIQSGQGRDANATWQASIMGNAQSSRESESPLMRLAATIAATHHEKWDGTGYPQGLAGEEIPIEGRITAVADVFDALTSRRPYKNAFDIEKAIEIMLENRGTQFDPDVLDAFQARFSDIAKVMVDFADRD
ncbi:response regulator [Pirellulales bacterium]|nr:response regulator [Pirellulales bacterium]